MADLKSRLQPLPLTGALQSSHGGPDPIEAPQPRDNEAPVDAWLEEHPEGFTETPAPAQTPPAVESKPVEGEVAPKPVAEPTPPEAVSAPEPTPTPAPEPAQPQAAAPTPAPAKPSYDPTEKIGLAEGVEWTRGQVVEALRERAASAPLAKEAESFRKLFGAEYAQVEQGWKPILERLNREPQTLAFLDRFLTDPARANYLEECGKFYDQQVQAQPGSQTISSQPTATTQTELERKVAELTAWRENAVKQQAVERVNREMSVATAKYPFLAEPQYAQALLLAGSALYDQDLKAGVPEEQRRGIPEALALNAPMYDAMMIARSNAPPPAAAVPAPQLAPVAAGGPAPHGTVRQNGKPQKFADLDEAVQSWADNPPPEFR